jgi:four helix bundle protein
VVGGSWLAKTGLVVAIAVSTTNDDLGPNDSNTQSRNQKVRSFRDLVVWQQAMTLAEEVYSATRGFPREEMYGLTIQMRRAAVSIASNIAEGQARQSRGELLQFIGHARGSLGELATQSILANRIGLLSNEQDEALSNRIARVGRLLNGLRKSLQT